MRCVAERAELGEQREAVLAVSIPETPGSFKKFMAADGMYDNAVIEQIGADSLVGNLVVSQAASDDQSTSYKAFADAFKAAGRDVPVIIMGNREDELKWWKEQKDANGYETMSVSIAPGVSTLAFWVAQQILDGADVPKDLTVPFLRIDQGTLEESLANTEPGGVANTEYSLDDAKKVVDEAKM